MKIVKHRIIDYNGYLILPFEQVSGGWNYQVKSHVTETVVLFRVNALYSTRKDAIESAKDWILQNPIQVIWELDSIDGVKAIDGNAEIPITMNVNFEK